MGEQKPGQRAAGLLVHDAGIEELIVQIGQAAVDVAFFDLFSDEMVYLEPIGLVDVAQPVRVLQDIVIQIRRAGIIHIVLIGEIDQHRLGNLFKGVQVQGHHEMLIQIGDPQLRVHACPVPREVVLSHLPALDEQRDNLLKQLDILPLLIQPFQRLEQHRRIVPCPVGQVDQLIRRLPLQRPLADAIQQHLLLEPVQPAQQSRIVVQKRQRFYI